MLDQVKNRFIEDDTPLHPRYLDYLISVESRTRFDQKKRRSLQTKHYEQVSPTNGRRYNLEHPTTCQCFKSNASSHWRLIYEKLMSIVSFCLTTPLLLILTLVALLDTAKRRWDLKRSDSNQTPMRQQNLQESNVDEKITQDELYYAKRWGYDCQQHKIATKDGYILTLYRFSQKRKIPAKGETRNPILIGHGLFQCSGNLILNEKDSLVFALVDEGYDVWTGNNRAVVSLEHTCLSSNDTSYWDWGLMELALCDFPAMLDHIRAVTGQERIGYIGHSQGNAQVFIALSLQPELADKMSCFIALAPAVVSGTLVSTFPLRGLVYMDKTLFRILFGKNAFLGIMTTAQRYLPPWIMSILAYSVFSYLFAWWDHHWVQRRKIKYFQFSPRPVSTQLVLDWLDGWGRQGVCLHVTTTSSKNHVINKCTTEKIPLAIIYGEDDHLVDGAAFVRSFKGYENHGMKLHPYHHHHQQQQGPSSSSSSSSSSSTENQHAFSFPSLNLVHVERVPSYEHMDTIWAHDSQLTTNPVIYRVLKAAKWEINTL